MSESWSIAIFSSREAKDTLRRNVEAAVEAGRGAMVDVLVNGNEELASSLPRMPGVRVWSIPLADKANAWNEYVRMWSPVEVAFFVDGYVELDGDSLEKIAAALRAEHVLAATGVPTMGRSAAKLRAAMLSGGGIHGNLFAVKGAVMRLIQRRGIRLPLGVYRNDGILGAFFAYNLDPRRYRWDITRIAVVPDASWKVHGETSLSGAMRRKLRQAQGFFENQAVREHLRIEQRRPEEMPETAAELVGQWMARHPGKARWAMLKNPLCYVAAKRLLTRKRCSGVRPQLVS